MPSLLLQALQAAVKSKKKITVGNLRDLSKKALSGEMVEAFKDQTEKLHSLVDSIKKGVEWQDIAVCTHSIYTSCTCGALYESAGGLLLKQLNRRGKYFRYIPIEADTPSDLPSMNLIRQEKVHGCIICKPESTIVQEPALGAGGQLSLGL